MANAKDKNNVEKEETKPLSKQQQYNQDNFYDLGQDNIISAPPPAELDSSEERMRDSPYSDINPYAPRVIKSQSLNPYDEQSKPLIKSKSLTQANIENERREQIAAYNKAMASRMP